MTKLKTCSSWLRSAYPFFCAAVLICVPGMAEATPLPVGGTLFPAPEKTDPVGGVAVASKTVPFVTANFFGTLKSQVFAGDASNALGGLTFTYQIYNDAGSSDELHRFSIINYALVNVDASYRSTSGQVVPFSLDRTSADVFGAAFANLTSLGYRSIGAGFTSALLVAQTDASANGYTSALANISDGVGVGVDSFAPVRSVPEPTSATLFAAALVGAAISIRGRRLRG